MKSSIFSKKIFLVSFLLIVWGCGSPDLPIDRIHQLWANVPTYTIVLQDMKEEGNFFTSYFHQYRIIQPESYQDSGWYEVPEDYYRKNEPFLGMALASKVDGVITNAVEPPVYRFVGNPNYGQWRSDGSGTTFWEFYGKYRLFTDILGAVTHRITETDYNAYRSFSSRNIPYYGLNNEFGTNGSYTQKNNPNFFQRRMAREQLKKASFASRVAERIGRSRTGFQSRSGGIGK